jgi:hypothetical protein
VIGENMTLFLEFIGYMFFSFIGSFIREFTNANKYEDYRFEPYRVITSTICGSIGAAAIHHIFFSSSGGWEIMMVIGFICGILGIELYQGASTVDGLKNLIRTIYEICTLQFLREEKTLADIEKEVEREIESQSSEVPKEDIDHDKLTEESKEVYIKTHYQKPTMIVHHTNEKDDPSNK